MGEGPGPPPYFLPSFPAAPLDGGLWGPLTTFGERMACYHPMQGWKSRSLNPSGKRSITFNKKYAFSDLPVTVPCGQCVGCRLERSRQWAIRCAHEADMWETNSFITLTYSDDHLPPNGSLFPEHFTLFMKKLRHESANKIRFYMCGEYGEKFGRPHYHACLFNYDFPDKVPDSENHMGQKLYTSELLSTLWPYGRHAIGDVTFESAAYVARYIMKKINGEQADEHYTRDEIDPFTGEINTISILPEYTRMSRGGTSKHNNLGGIGKPWFDKYGENSVYNDDSVVINGRKMRPPKYYDRQYELTSEKQMARIKAVRKTKAKQHEENNTPARLATRETVQTKKLEKLKRNFDEG